jgi:glutathione S-transferase
VSAWENSAMNNEEDIRAHTMTLFWSSRSPFVRKVMVVAHEVGLADRILLRRVNVSMLRPDRDVVAVNAIGRIPVLLTPDRWWLPDSQVIAEYLDTLGGGPRLFPSGAERWRALAWAADGDGLMETLVTWRSERERPAGSRSDAFIDAYRAKFIRVADVLEARAEALAAAPFSIGHVTIGCALAYADFRFEAEEWRDHRPALAAWHAAFSRRAAVVATEFVNEY